MEWKNLIDLQEFVVVFKEEEEGKKKTTIMLQTWQTTAIQTTTNL